MCELKKCSVEIKKTELMAFRLGCSKNIWTKSSGVLHEELGEAVV